jgi:uncharacterized protein (DUF1499 family)
MSPLKFFVVILIAVSVVTAVLAGGALAYGREAIWEHIFGPPDLGPYDFDLPKRTGKLNDALACPAESETCVAASMDRATPVFAVDGQALLAAARDILVSQAEAVVVDDRPDSLSFRAVVRSPVLRFPDTVSVRVRERAPGESVIWIYSRSQIGHADLGGNERRIRRVMRELRQTLPVVPPPAG